MHLHSSTSTVAGRLSRPGAHRVGVVRAFRSDDTNAPTSSAAARTSAQLGGHTTSSLGPTHVTLVNETAEPLWRKPSFPYVVIIALATLPYDLAFSQAATRSGSQHPSRPQDARDGLNSRPPRHAKPVKRPARAPAGNAHSAKQGASAAAFGQHHTARPAASIAAEAVAAAKHAQAAAAEAQGAAARSISTAQAASERWGGTVPARADASNAAANREQARPTEASLHAVVAEEPVGSVDSWDAAGYGSTDEDAEQAAKAMVIELITHPKDMEEALVHAAGPSGGSSRSGAQPFSVSPDYIDALVQAVKDPTVGMPQHQPSLQEGADTGATAARGGGSTTTFGPGGASKPGTGAENQVAASPGVPTKSTPAVGVRNNAMAAGQGRARPQSSNPSLWSWLDGSPQTSQDEF